MVFEHRGWRVAAMADEVLGVRGFLSEERQALPSTHAGIVYSQGWFGDDGRIIAHLDEELLFDALRRQLS